MIEWLERRRATCFPVRGLLADEEDEMTHKPWLGAQEAHYASLLWHLDVPDGYTSQVDATRSVFPGKAMVNVNRTPANAAIHDANAQVKIKGFAQAWITDMECATSLQPKMFGFDFARVTEVYRDAAGKRRLVVERSQAEREANSGLANERAMMKDLMLSVMREGGEVTMTYHMLNPFITNQDEVEGDKIGSMLSFVAETDFHLGKKDFASGPDAELVNARAIIKRNAELLGEFLDDVLSSQHSNGKNIWLRLLHEPNVNHFWWGHPKPHLDPAGPSTTGSFYENFTQFWIFMVEEVLRSVSPDNRGRVKLVFCINGERSDQSFQDKLDAYLPTASLASQPSNYTSFLQSIDVLGLDYYEDWEDEYSKATLPAEYAAIKAKTGEIKSRFNRDWKHALTEVSIRTVGTYKGKLYGEYAGVAAWPKKALVDVNGETKLLSNRRFFEEVVYKVAKEHNPEWVMFWVNRVGNSILSSYEPTTGQTRNGMPEVFYHDSTNVFSSDEVQHFFPIFPAEPFVVETFKAGDDSGAKTFFPISQTDQIPKLPGGGAGADLTNHVNPYKDAILDFFQMVPPTRRTANTAMARAVEQFLCDPALPRPVIDPAPTAAQRAELLFEVL